MGPVRLVRSGGGGWGAEEVRPFTCGGGGGFGGGFEEAVDDRGVAEA